MMLPILYSIYSTRETIDYQTRIKLFDSSVRKFTLNIVSLGPC